MTKYERLINAITEIANLYTGKTIQLQTSPDKEDKFAIEILYYTLDIASILKKYEIEVISIYSKDNSPFLLAEMRLIGQYNKGYTLAPIIPTEQRVIEKSLEFEDAVGINKFAAGAMWMKSMLLVKND